MSEVTVSSPGPKGDAGSSVSGDSSKQKAVTSVASTPFAPNDTHHFLKVDASGGAITIDLPASASNARKEYKIKKVDATANQVILDPNGAETIDGQATLTLDFQFQSFTVTCDGSNWHIV